MNSRRGVLLTILSGYAVLLVAAFLLTADWQARQTWAVVFTGAVIIWYTWETHQLRRVSQRQIELQIRPFVVLNRQSGKFHVTNIGNGPALNVRVDQVSIMPAVDAFIRFPESIPVLKPTQTEPIAAESFIGGKSQGGFLDAHLDPQHANQAFEITVRYQDTDFVKHTLTMRTQPGRFTIVSFEERAA